MPVLWAVATCPELMKGQRGSVLVGYGSGSTNAKQSACDDGLTNLNALKVRSTPNGDIGYQGNNSKTDALCPITTSKKKAHFT